MNPHASKRYFTAAENATIGTFESFRKRKTPETIRIFVLGESTTLGYPYMYNASFHRWLSFRLMHTFPDKQFEIINLSLTAVNSYTVLGFTKELVDYQPDAILIYCGQNEYYGTLGVGSTSRMGSSRFLVQSVLYLRSARLAQLLGNSISLVKSAVTGKQVNTRETLMRRMAAKQEIPFNSGTYERGIRQFQKNMDAVCRLLSKKKIPVFLSNLVSNERDLEPFISSGKDSAYSADYHFALAGSAYEKGNFAKAKQEYILAKDLDMLRFRAPDTLNKIIAALPGKYDAVHLVDTRKIFEEHAPHGIIGSETILEHVHPNIYGYGLMSEAFYQSFKQYHFISPSPESEISFEQLQREMPITKVDSLKGTYEITVLKENWPFNREKSFDANQLDTYEEKMALALLNRTILWNDAMPQLMNYYLNKGDQVNAARVAESVALQYANDATFLFYAGKFCLNLQKNDKARVYYQHAFRLTPKFEIAQDLAILYLKSDNPEKAIHYLNYLVRHNQSKINYSQALSLTNEVIELKSKLRHDPANPDLMNQIAISYFNMQNMAIARLYAEKALRIDSRNNTAKELLRKLKTITPDVP